MTVPPSLRAATVEKLLRAGFCVSPDTWETCHTAVRSQQLSLALGAGAPFGKYKLSQPPEPDLSLCLHGLILQCAQGVITGDLLQEAGGQCGTLG